VTIQDEHVEALRLDDTPDIVVIQVYLTSGASFLRTRETCTVLAELTFVSAACMLLRFRKRPLLMRILCSYGSR
jgi:hypothetical protein